MLPEVLGASSTDVFRLRFCGAQEPRRLLAQGSINSNVVAVQWC